MNKFQNIRFDQNNGFVCIRCHNTHSTGRTAIHLTTHEPTRQKPAASKEGKLAVCKEGEKIALYSVAFQ